MMGLSPVSALAGLFESLASNEPSPALALACHDVDTLLEFRDARDALRPIVSGAIHALCHLVEDTTPRGVRVLEQDADLLGLVWQELTVFDAWLEELLRLMAGDYRPELGGYQRHLLPVDPSGPPHLLRLLNSLAAADIADSGQLILPSGSELISEAGHTRWRVLAPASHLMGALLATNRMHTTTTLQRLPAVATFIRECHAGMAWLDALPSRISKGELHAAISA
ncbi:hypothetical protein [Modicisalibacter radicis]|uniref:hypothetical protein n=1 Tax=Halomonas sp. EAR18 TaxID=2518972 RepID=UPI00109D1C43|nr:hypothetical protein [Halomonas sp. EAR18]